MTIMLGKVSCDLHKCSSKVRVAVFGTDGIPLSVKASLSGYSRNLFKKDVVVEVEQAPHDGRLFRVTKVFEALDSTKKPIVVNANFNIRVPNAAALARGYGGKPMEKVKFYLNSSYFDHPEMKDVLIRTLNLRAGEFLRAKDNSYGLAFICTTDQFARFLIERNQYGIKNGFMDLGAKLIRPAPEPNAYDLLAKAAGITHDQAKRVALALCYGSPSEIMERIKIDPETPRDHARQIDVSDR